jgi:hypothetical protein
VPVQRVTKYPLLLARLHKVTPAHHAAQRELLKQAQHKIELHLEHMNSVSYATARRRGVKFPESVFGHVRHAFVWYLIRSWRPAILVGVFP